MEDKASCTNLSFFFLETTKIIDEIIFGILYFLANVGLVYWARVRRPRTHPNSPWPSYPSLHILSMCFSLYLILSFLSNHSCVRVRGVRRLRRPPLSSYDNGNAASLQQRPSDEVAPVSSGKPLLLPPASPLQLQPSSPDLAGLVGAGRRQHASVAQLGRPPPAPFRLTMPPPPTPAHHQLPTPRRHHRLAARPCPPPIAGPPSFRASL